MGPLLVRIFHRILARRLEALPLNRAQRGFMSLDGTLANSLSLWTIIKHQRDHQRPYYVSTLDLRKAFDTVPHPVIERALRHLGVDDRFTWYVMSSLTGCSIAISCEHLKTEAIPIHRGVKQGDPISPLLFNAVIDELICRLQSMDAGIQIGAATFIILAYADDLVLVSSSLQDHSSRSG